MRSHIANLKPDHLRVCGADTMSGVTVKTGDGSPPRVRSRRHVR